MIGHSGASPLRPLSGTLMSMRVGTRMKPADPERELPRERTRFFRELDPGGRGLLGGRGAGAQRKLAIKIIDKIIITMMTTTRTMMIS